MPRSNNTRFVILGFLAREPQSGYDIRKAIAGSLGNFWNESFGQIYPALKDLEAEGLIRRVEGETRRQVYTITPRGRAALETWVKQPAEPHVYRVETLVKLFFSPLTGPAAARAHVARFKAEHAALMAKYQAIGEMLDRTFQGDPGFPYWKLTVACGLTVGQAYLDWCAQAEAVLADLDGGKDHA